jgi:AcrR family transcriptional regulator
MSRKEQAEASRAALVVAARACFTERGYDDTTVAAILDRADMARGALYHYFPGGKAQIFEAVFDLVDAEYHVQRDASLALPSAVDRLKGGVSAFLELCTDESFARIALADAPRVIPGQGELGSSYKLLRQQLADAITTGELRSLDVDATSMALYGAIRNAGEYVIGSSDPQAVVDVAKRTIAALIDGLRDDRSGFDGEAH